MYIKIIEINFHDFEVYVMKSGKKSFSEARHDVHSMASCRVELAGICSV